MAKQIIRQYTKSDGTVVPTHMREIRDTPKGYNTPTAATFKTKPSIEQQEAELLDWLTDEAGGIGRKTCDVADGPNENGWSREDLFIDQVSNQNGDAAIGAEFTNTYYHETGVVHESVVYIEVDRAALASHMDYDPNGDIDEDDPYTWPADTLYIMERTGTGEAVRDQNGNWTVEEIDTYEYAPITDTGNKRRTLLDYEHAAASYAIKDDRIYLEAPTQ